MTPPSTKVCIQSSLSRGAAKQFCAWGSYAMARAVPAAVVLITVAWSAATVITAIFCTSYKGNTQGGCPSHFPHFIYTTESGETETVKAFYLPFLQLILYLKNNISSAMSIKKTLKKQAVSSCCRNICLSLQNAEIIDVKSVNYTYLRICHEQKKSLILNYM